MRKAKHVISLLLCFTLLVGILPINLSAVDSEDGFANFTSRNEFSDGMFEDVGEDEWSYDNIKSAYELGLMLGNSETTFNPDGNVTIAQTITIAARIHSIYAYGTDEFEASEPWYQAYVDYAIEQGIIDGEYDDYGDFTTRADFAYIMAAALPAAALEAVNKVADGKIPDVDADDYYADAVYVLYRAGILTGNDEEGTFAPDSYITRGEVATVSTRMADKSLRREITLGEEFVVSFDVNGARKSIPEQIVFEGETADEPDVPTRGMYIFNGWLTEDGEEFDFDTPITDDITLTADWKLDKTAMSMLMGGGKDLPEDDEPEDPDEPDVPDEPDEPDVPEGTTYTVEFNLNYEGAPEPPTAQTVNAGEKAAEPQQPARENYVFCGWSTRADGSAWYDYSIDFDGYRIDKDTVFYAIWMEDSTDIDGDGLSHKDETAAQTDPYLYDTDGDGLSDGEEVETYNTDPLDEDSDNDGVADGLEVSVGLDPLNPKTDASTPDAEKVVGASYETYDGLFTLYLEATPSSLSTFSAESLSLDNLVDSTGLVSPLISVSHDPSQTFEEAELVFDYSSLDLTDIDEDELSFVYLNESTGKYELVDSKVDKVNKRISAKPEHFSFYAVGKSLLNMLGFSFGGDDEIVYDGKTVNVKKVAVTGFDVQKHAYAFHNFQIKELLGGFCYGFSYTTYYNYMHKLPLVGENYNLSNELRFHSEQLYIPSENDLFVEGNDDSTKNDDYLADNENERHTQITHVLNAIIEWHLNQNILKSAMSPSIESVKTFEKLKNLLNGDEPGILGMMDRLLFSQSGHSVLIYGMYKALDTNEYYLSVYDSRYPGEMRYVKCTHKNGLFGKSIKAEYENYSVFSLIDPPETEGEYVPHKFTVSGKVIGSDGQIPMGAVVSIKSGAFLSECIVRSDGSFSAGSIPNGRYELVISADGYDQYVDTITVSGKDFDSDTPGTIVLNRESRKIDITGMISIADSDTDMTNNAPLGNAYVSIRLKNGKVVDCYTDAAGKYLLKGIPTGIHTLTVTKDGYIPITETIKVTDEDSEVVFNITIEAISETYRGYGYAGGSIFDAGTGRILSGMTLKIRKGLENTTGAVIATLSSTVSGYMTEALEAGNYTVEIVDARTGISEENRYYSSHFNIKILGTKTIGNQNGYVSNGLISGELRTVLTWGSTPRDLDSHMVGPDGNGGKFHVYYANKGNGTNTDLDVDDTSSYGPETVTIYRECDGVYVYAVYDFTNGGSGSSMALSKSGAKVVVRRGAQEIKTFNVPTNVGGTLWIVYSYDSRTGKITTINEVVYDTPFNLYGNTAVAMIAEDEETVSKAAYDEYAALIVSDILASEKP